MQQATLPYTISESSLLPKLTSTVGKLIDLKTVFLIILMNENEQQT